MTTQEHPEPEKENLDHIVGRLAGAVARLDPGRRATLRRMDAERDPPLEFIKLMVTLPIPRWEHNPRAWQTLVAGMTLFDPPPAGTRSSRLGRALAEGGFSEARLERLLAAQGAAGRRLFLRACRFLATRGMPINWLDAAQFLLATDPQRARNIRLSIARSFFRTQASASDRRA